MKKYTADIERCPETSLYVGYIPGFPGAHSQAETLDELNRNLKEVVEMLLEDGDRERTGLELGAYGDDGDVDLVNAPRGESFFIDGVHPEGQRDLVLDGVDEIAVGVDGDDLGPAPGERLRETHPELSQAHNGKSLHSFLRLSSRVPAGVNRS